MEKKEVIVMIGCRKCMTLAKENEGYDFCKQLQPGLFQMIDDSENGIDTSGLCCECDGEYDWVIYDLTNEMLR